MAIESVNLLVSHEIFESKGAVGILGCLVCRRAEPGMSDDARPFPGGAARDESGICCYKISLKLIDFRNIQRQKQSQVDSCNVFKSMKYMHTHVAYN